MCYDHMVVEKLHQLFTVRPKSNKLYLLCALGSKSTVKLFTFLHLPTK